MEKNIEKEKYVKPSMEVIQLDIEETVLLSASFVDPLGPAGPGMW